MKNETDKVFKLAGFISSMIKTIKNRKQLIKLYLDFFKNKRHEIIPNASLIPENDPTVLFTTAGMHPLVPFLLGQPHPQGKKLANVQRCIRTQDIDEVGDGFHHTFFEMLGNWSLGDYFKEKAVEMSFEFLTSKRWLNIPKEKLAVSVFGGDRDASRDEESAKIWKKIGIPKERIVYLPKEENWWGPAGKTGPCGPDTEMFYYIGKKKLGKKSNPKTKKTEWCEIWNDVFMQYNKNEKGEYKELKQKNVDTGMGVERTIAILTGVNDDYLTDSFYPAIKNIESLSGKSYGKDKEETKAMRIIADHVKAAVFILAEGIEPGNVEQGYVLRRLIRRAIRFGRLLGIESNFLNDVARVYFEIYDDYAELEKNRNFILEELEKEENRFRKRLERGTREFNKISERLLKEGKKKINARDAFLLYQSYGFPLEMTIEMAKEKGLKIDSEDFDREFKRHQELSRTASAGRFKSGLADKSEKTKKLHTATHLLHAALRRVLGKHVQQRGSNITAERLRFDFTYPKKLTNEELKKVEDLVNMVINKKLDVKREEMTLEEAKKRGALAFFSEKYGKRVSVYSIGEGKKAFSKEVCAGPHVENTAELGRFRIKKEEAVGVGVRRIKAVLE